MSNEQIERRIAGLLESVRPELTPALEERTAVAIRAVRPAHVRPRRLIAIATTAAVAIVGLGFVPVPAGSAKGALTRAMAAADGATGIFVRTLSRNGTGGEAGESRLWLAAGGLWRNETWRGGELEYLHMIGKDSFAKYSPSERTALVGEWRHPDWMARSLLRGSRITMDRADVFDFAAARSGAEVTESREWSLWGGVRDVAEIVERTDRECYEFDAKTGRMLSYQFYIRAGGSWKLVSWTEEVKWDVEIPEETWTFDSPPGTKVTVCDTWWSGREHEMIARDRTADWELTIYTMDRDRQGNLYLAIGWQALTDQARLADSSDTLTAAATDNLGCTYVHDNAYRSVGDAIVLLKLTRQSHLLARDTAHIIAITVQAGHYGLGAGQVVTFPDLPLPPRQEQDDLLELRTVQY